MRSYGLLIGLLTGLCLSVRAQQPTPEPTGECCLERPPGWIIKFAPLSLLDPDNTVQFGVERLLGRRYGRYAVQAEIGYGRQGFSPWNTSLEGQFTNRETWRGRAEWRVYVDPEDKPLGVYLAVEGLFKQVSILEKGIDNVPCYGQCPPGSLTYTPALKHIGAGHLKVGYQLSQSSDNRLLLDVYGGVGFRYRQVDRPDLPAGVVLEEPYGSFNSASPFPAQPQTTPSLSLGIKFGYAF